MNISSILEYEIVYNKFLAEGKITEVTPENSPKPLQSLLKYICIIAEKLQEINFMPCVIFAQYVRSPSIN